MEAIAQSGGKVLAMKKPSRKKDADWQVFERQARICKAFSSPIRLYIIKLLGQGERPLSELQEELGISVPNLSQHLAVLRAAGVVQTRREGQHVFCSLPIPEVTQACTLIHGVIRRQIEQTKSLLASG